jgi:hypothetical protein
MGHSCLCQLLHDAMPFTKFIEWKGQKNMDLENKLSFYLWVKAMNCVTNLIKLGTKLAQTLQGNAVKFTSCSTNFE